MTSIGLDSVQSRGGQTQSAQNQVMGKDDFLHLLVAQLQAQDQLNPMDSTGFTAQLAQFSSLEQLQNVNNNLEGLGTSQSIQTNSQAVGFIGREVTALGDRVQVTDGQSADLPVSLDQDAAAVHVKIYDMDGNFIRDMQTGPMAAGQGSISWDAVDYLGGQAPDGQYQFEASAVDANGDKVEVMTLTSGTVTGVTFKNGQAYLLTEDQQIPMGSVVQVSEPTGG
ncbi:MAG: flagellar hook capping FlgD N-terminal domain-containing protein [Desulfosarcinaceae bacterium]